MRKLPLATQTLYAELLEQLLALDAHRSIGQAPGCFTTKEVKGEVYYYFQYSEPGGKPRQSYVGKKTPALDKVVARFREEREAFHPDAEQIQRLCAQLRAGGTLRTDTASTRVLEAFAESGLFHLGGVLVGTHAFTVLGNLLGVKWDGYSLRTQDIDIASDSTLRIAVPDLQADMPKVLETLTLGFLPVPGLNPKSPSTSFKVRGSPLRVDFVTPQKRSTNSTPLFIPRFNVAAQPLPFLDYVTDHYERGAIVNGDGVLVNVPNPARFAFHKLIVSRSRGIAASAKVDKDIFQAAQVLAVLAEDRSGDLLLAWDDLERRGDGWVKRVVAALPVLARQHRSEYTKMLDAVPKLRSHIRRRERSSLTL